MTRTTDTRSADYQLARAFLREQYRHICEDFPRAAADMDVDAYCRANINAVLTFDRRMRLLRMGRGDVVNAWSPEAVRLIGF